MSMLNRVIIAKESVSTERYNICLECDNLRKTIKICKLCGCFMPAKTKLPWAECPDDPPKWNKVSKEDTVVVPNTE